MRLAPLCFALIASTATAAELELKNIRPGMTLDQLNSLYPTLNCKPAPKADGIDACRYTRKSIDQQNVTELNTLAEELVESWGIEFSNNKLGAVLILFDHDKFNTITTALRAKFGTPAIVRGTVQNRAGATFPSSTLTWRTKTAFLKAQEHVADIETSAITLMSQAHAAYRVKAVESPPKSKAKDL